MNHGVLELLVYVVWFVVHHGLMTCDWCAVVVRCVVHPVVQILQVCLKLAFKTNLQDLYHGTTFSEILGSGDRPYIK